MKGRLVAVSFANWAAIDVSGITHWLWMDTSGAGLHLAPSLGEPPADVSFVWGWDDDPVRLVRLRVDRDLLGAGQAAAVGSVLDLTGTGEGDEVDVDVWDGQVWHPSDGRINVEQSHPVFSGTRLSRLFTVHRDSVDFDGAITQTPLTFVHLGSESAR